MSTYRPGSLPDIDAVSVVDLRGQHANRVDDYMCLPHLPEKLLTGEDAQEVARLWRALPEGAQDRCHVPPFGLRFLRAGTVIAEASLCWGCNNAFGLALEGELHFAFDARSEPARALLARAKGLFGRTPESGR